MPQPRAEVTLGESDVARLLAAQHPDLRGPLIRVAHGWDNEVFRLGDELAVRLPRRAAAARLVEHEQRWLPRIAPMLPVPVPAPVAVGIPQDDYPWHWSVVPWFEGVRALDLAPEERDLLAEPLADALLALHVAAPHDAPRNPVRGVPLRERDDAVRPRLAGVPALAPIWEDALAAAEWDGDAVWVHGDVHPGNLVARDGRLVAMIDFGDMCAGDPACDLAVAWTAFSPAGRERFVERLGSRYDDAVWRRARGWAVAIATLVADSDDAGFRAMSVHAVEHLLR